jgi:outer membrane protein, heavy metal efflux system
MNRTTCARKGPTRRLAAVCVMLFGLCPTVGVGEETAAVDAPTPASASPLVNPATPELVIAPPAEPEPLPPASLSLADLEGLALAGNPALARAGALINAARANCLQVGLRPNPAVGYEGQQLGSGGAAEQHGVLFSQEIVTGGKLRLNRAVASQQIVIAEQEYAATRQRILTDVRTRFYRVLVAQRQIELAQELIHLSQQVVASVNALHEAKEVGKVDVLQASLERQQAEILLASAEQRIAAAWRELAAVVGSPSMPVQPLAGDPGAETADISFDEALARIQSESPEVAAAFAEVQRACMTLARERVEPIPNVTFEGIVNVIDNGIGGTTDGGVLLSVPVPIFDRNQGAILRAQREVTAARQAVSQLELDLQRRLAPVYENFATSRQQAAQYRESILPQAAESLELTRTMYEAGEINYTGLLTAQRTFALANRDYLDIVLRLRTAEAEIEGLLLSDSLGQPPSETVQNGADRGR